MDSFLLFTDGSVNTKTKIGCGAYLLIPDEELKRDFSKLKINTKIFENTSSTKLEIQTLLWALKEINNSEVRVVVHTDSNNIISLPDRRVRLENSNYYSKSKKLLKNHEFYKEFYKLIDKMNCEFVKVIGHQKSDNKSEIDKLFSFVDKAARKTLRKDTYFRINTR